MDTASRHGPAAEICAYGMVVTFPAHLSLQPAVSSTSHCLGAAAGHEAHATRRQGNL